MQTQSVSLMAAAWPAEGQARWIRDAVLVLAGTALIAICAKTQVPMWPVPMTMQTWAVLLIGAAYGWRLGGITVLAYLLEGIAGLPVFAGPTAGIAYMAGPTAGYLVGFLVSAMLVGWLAERGWDRSLAKLVTALFLASIAPFIFGVAWLTHVLSLNPDIASPFQAALAAGVTPFIPGMVLKLALAAAVLKAGWAIVQRLRG